MPILPLILTAFSAWLWYQAFIAWKTFQASGNSKDKTQAMICAFGALVAMAGGVMGGL